MTVTSICGRTIASELPLREYGPEPLEGNAVDLHLLLGPEREETPIKRDAIVNEHRIGETPFLTIARRDDGHAIRAHGHGDFIIDSTRAKVTCFPLPGAQHTILAQLFVDRVLPNTISSASSPVFHSSVVAYQTRAVMFVGDPGLGKSTLASALCPPFDWMCDDAAALEQRGARFDVHASYSFARLFDDSLGAMGGSREHRASARNHKWRLKQQTPVRRASLSAVISLGADEPLQMTRLSQRDAVAELARHLYRLDPLDRRSLIDELPTLQQLSESAVVARFDYPRRFDALNEVRNRVFQLLEETDSNG